MLNRLLGLKVRAILPDRPVTRRPLTEPEFLAWADRKGRQTAAELSGLLPDGLRFEWSASDRPPAD